MPTNDEINAFVTDVLARSISDGEKAQIIADAAAQYGVSNAQIAAATGYDVQTVNDYLVVPQHPEIAAWAAAPTDVVMITNEQINNFVSDVLANPNISNAEKASIINQAADTYNVSNADIAIATGYNLAVVNQFLNQETATGLSYSDVNAFVVNILNDPTLNDAQRATTILQAAATYGVSNQEIAAATGYDLNTVNAYLAQAMVPVVAQPGGETAVVQPGGGTAVVQPGGGTAIVQPGGGTVVVQPGDGTVVVQPGGGTAVVKPVAPAVVTTKPTMPLVVQPVPTTVIKQPTTVTPVPVMPASVTSLVPPATYDEGVEPVIQTLPAKPPANLLPIVAAAAAYFLIGG